MAPLIWLKSSPSHLLRHSLAPVWFWFVLFSSLILFLHSRWKKGRARFCSANGVTSGFPQLFGCPMTEEVAEEIEVLELPGAGAGVGWKVPDLAAKPLRRFVVAFWELPGSVRALLGFPRPPFRNLVYFEILDFLFGGSWPSTSQSCGLCSMRIYSRLGEGR